MRGWIGVGAAAAMAGALLLIVNGALAGTTRVWSGELPGDTVFTLADSPHIVTADLIVPAGVTLTIEPGVEVRFAPNAALIVRGRLWAVGAPTQTIRLTHRDAGTWWSMLIVDDSPLETRIAYAEIEFMRGIQSEHSPFSILHSDLHDIQGDALVTLGGAPLIQGNHLHDVYCPDRDCEALQVRDLPPDAPALILDNYIHDVDDDCIDVTAASAIIERNRLHHCPDKGVSIGPYHVHGGAPPPSTFPSSATLVNTLIYSASIGVAVKDGSFAHIIHATIVGNREGIALYESWDLPGYGGGRARIVNSILWGNRTQLRLDLTHTPPASATVLFSDVAGGWEGEGNLDAEPAFGDGFRLRDDSPLVDRGRDEGVRVDLDGAPRPAGAAPDIGAYEAQPALLLSARAGDGEAYLTWELLRAPPGLASFAISATVRAPHPPPSLTGLPTTTRAYTLSGLTNYVRYTFIVEARDALNGVLARSNPADVIPNHGFTACLPLVVRAEPPPDPPEPPLYRLLIAPADLNWLYANYQTDQTVPGLFLVDGDSPAAYAVRVRFRGDSARYHSKKSWKIEFPAAAPFRGQRELNLNAEYPDKSLLREALAFDLFHRAGLTASQVEFVRLEINGQYAGVFLQVEQVDQRFLERVGWDANGNLYKGMEGSDFNWGGDFTLSYVKKTNKEDGNSDLLALLWLVNFSSDAQFPAALAEYLDVGRYLDWYAVQIALGNYEWLEKNYYLYHHPASDMWELTPWDLDLTLGHNWGRNGVKDLDITWDNPIDSGVVSSPKPDGRWNKLITRVLANAEFRFAYCRRLQELLSDEFSEAAMFSRIDALYAHIAAAAEADTAKWGTNEEFHAGPAELKMYVTNRLAWLAGRVPGYCPAVGPLPLINEWTPEWVELYNPGLVSFDAGGMSLRAVGLETLTWTLPAGTVIAPRGFLTVPQPGVISGVVFLLDKPLFGARVVDQVEICPSTCGRFPDGASAWVTLTAPTPRGSNLGPPPLIADVSHAPAEPDAGQPATVTAFVSGGLEVTLHWTARGANYVAAMHAAGDGWYSTTIPPLSGGTVVTYHVRAADAAGRVSLSPPRAPARTYRYVVGFHRPPLRLNELLAVNRAAHADEAGEYDDYFEIVNAGDAALDMSGMYLTDEIARATKWRIPAGVTIPPGGRLIFWADNQPEQGPTHVNFELDGDGDRLALYASADGYRQLIDEVYYGPQTVDRAWGRYPDGVGEWLAAPPTPGAPNPPPAPLIRGLSCAGDVVAAEVEGSGAPVSATLHYALTSTFHTAPMEGGRTFRAAMPLPPDGTPVRFYVRAWDGRGGAAVYPTDAPTVAYACRAGAPPPLRINEFLASNATVIRDEWGAYEDWIELHNAGDAALDLGGMYLTDDLSRPTKWRIPDGVWIEPGGFLLIWADDDEWEGPLHAAFKLDKSGEEIGLFDRDGVLVDRVVFGPQATDLSAGRAVGGAGWRILIAPTPGEGGTR